MTSSPVFFNPAVLPLLESLNECPSNHCPDDFLCCEEEVATLIRSLDVSKASGPDGISSRMLQGTLESIVPSLTKLFNISIRTGKFPQCWKESSIVPIPKGGDNSKPGNYRPISLLSIMSKLLERHFHWLLTDHFNTSYQLALNQWGFQHGKSAVASLLTVVHAWLQALETGKEILAIFFRKAFDSVPRVPLLQKLEATGLHPYSEMGAKLPYSAVSKSGCWWRIFSSFTSAVWSTTGLSVRTLAVPYLHQ